MADSTAHFVLIIVFLLSSCLRDHKAAAQTSLSSSVEFPVCPGQEVVLTCTGDGISTALQWMVTPQAGETVTVTYLSSGVNETTNRTVGGNFIQAVLISTDPLTSTLTTTADTTLDGTVVQCTSGSSDTLTLQVIVPPPPPTSPTSMVTGQTAGTTSATVTVQWGASTGASVSYTVSISPAVFEQVTVAGSVTSLVLEDVPYSTYTISIVASNCAGSSAAESVTFTIVPCVVPDSPLNGEWLQFSPSETVGPGTSLSLSCNPGYEPTEVMASTCQSDGSWEPDTAQLECTVAAQCVVPDSPMNGEWLQFSPSETVGPGTSLSLSCNPGYEPREVMASTCQADGSWEPDTAQLECVLVDCGPPTLASGVVLEAPVSSTTFNSTFSFRCEEGLVPSATFEAVCGADGQWSPDPANHTCACICSMDTSACTANTELSTGVAITAVLCSVVFFILGAVFGILIYYCITAKRAQYSVSSSSTGPQTPAPVYDYITATDTHPKAIELSENIAYGPARR